MPTLSRHCHARAVKLLNSSPRMWYLLVAQDIPPSASCRFEVVVLQGARLACKPRLVLAAWEVSLMLSQFLDFDDSESYV